LYMQALKEKKIFSYISSLLIYI